MVTEIVASASTARKRRDPFVPSHMRTNQVTTGIEPITVAITT